MFTVPSCFIATFKVGDNVNHNLSILRLLYELCEQDNSRTTLLRKPMVVTIVSVAEAMLYDFIDRIQSPERVETLSKQTVAAIREGKYKNLTALIDCAQRYDLFNTRGDFYAKLNDLRKLRNRVHIQNEKSHFERDEDDAFNLKRLRMAEETAEYIAKFLAARHPRKSSTHGFVGDFEFPWDEHYS